VLGPRSAILAPVCNLGLVVVDEEQDSSFKQDSAPRYNGRDVALVRAHAADAVALLVSATPSLETRYNVERGKLELLPLTERVAGGRLPEGIVVDLRTEKSKPRRPGEVRFSECLLDELTQALKRGEQVILLRNRRGYSPVLLCRGCGEKLECDQCGLPRTYHRREGRMLCHYCGSAQPVPSRCPSCSESAFDPIGTGTERVEESFRELFPETSVDVLDRDAGRRVGGVTSVLQRFADGQTQVLIGTQMVSKGHHFPAVSLTAVLSADSYLSFPDFRAVERTYSMLTQLGGRAGRGEIPGKLVIQTYHPDHYAIQSALSHDDERFAEAEMRFRRTFHYPPYSRMVQLLFRGKDRARTEARSHELAKQLGRHPIARECRIAGPAPAPLERLKGSWRFQMLVRHPSSSRLRELLLSILPDGGSQDLVVDVDPQSLM
jgi:primosomal protein N' (replication factor Y)